MTGAAVGAGASLPFVPLRALELSASVPEAAWIVDSTGRVGRPS
jgi:hypothetical protein